MVKNLVIGTLNVRNRYKVKNYNGIDNGKDNALLLRDFLNSREINILGTQELVYLCIQRLNRILSGKYSLIGDYRLPEFVNNRINILERFNETNSIITDRKVLDYNTLRLPFVPSPIPRIVTDSYIDTNEVGVVRFINTHLDYLIEDVQIRQMQKLLEIASKTSGSTIFTGDFNMDMSNRYFSNFVEQMKKYDLIRVPIDQRTYKGSKTDSAIDHIFVSKDLKVIDALVVKDPTLDDFSDHYPILAKIIN